MSGEKIMIVDDDPDIQELIRIYLKQEEYEALSIYDGRSVIEEAKRFQPDLIILDIMIPGMDGIELCRSLRTFTDVPILFLSARQDEMNKIMGLSTGGDDYITKPFSTAELLVRIRAHLRRNRILSQKIADQNEASAPVTTLRRGDLLLDYQKNQVWKNGELLPLSTKEYQILALLMGQPNRTFSHEELYETLWGKESFGDTRTVHVHISNLRKKVESDPENPSYILTIRGKGYTFQMDEKNDAGGQKQKEHKG